MACAKIKIGDTYGIICGIRAGKARICPFCKTGFADLQCDWKIGHGKTCDAWMCRNCAQHVGENKDLCPIHQEAWKQWQKDHVSAKSQK